MHPPANNAQLRCTDKDNREKLLKDMADLDHDKRAAYFECVLAVAIPGGDVKCVHGILEGTITDKERGGSGFGYDPLFLKYEYSKTLSELDEGVKNRISHRRRALDKLEHYLENLGADTVSQK